jgi:hypothetical protein
MFKRALCIVVIVLGSWPAYSQEACTALLQYGIFDVTDASSQNEQAEAFANWICSNESDMSTKNDDTNLWGDIPYKQARVQFGYTKTNDSTNSWIHDYCSNVEHSSWLKANTKTFVRTVNKDLVQGFNECMKVKGLHVWLEPTSDPKVVRLATVFFASGKTKEAFITRFDANEGVHCDVPVQSSWWELFKKDDPIDGSTHRYKCTRSVQTTPIALSLNATEDPIGGGKLQLPGMPAPVQCPANCSEGCRIYGGKPFCIQSECAFSGIDGGGLNEGGMSPELECKMRPGHFAIRGNAGIGPRGGPTKDGWVGTVQLLVNDGSGNWAAGDAQTPLPVPTTPSADVSLSAAGDTHGDGTVRVKVKVLTCRVHPDTHCQLGVAPINMTITLTTPE